MTAVLFVCTGNICRSPTAEGIFRRLAHENGRNDILIDSAGISAFHVGQSPDPRAVETALQNGVDIRNLCARSVCDADYARFDLILTAERSQADRLIAKRPSGDAFARARVETMMSYAPEYGLPDVPDPYYGGDSGFVTVFHILTDVCTTLLDCIKKEEQE